MLITSDTMPPLLDGNGNPVRNGFLYVHKEGDPMSKLLGLVDSEGNPAENPIPLLSTGRMKEPVYIRPGANGEEINSAWCFLWDNRDGVKVFIRDYPLQNEPTQRELAWPQDLTARTLTVEKELKTGSLEASSIRSFEMGTKALNTSTIESEVLRFRQLVTPQGVTISDKEGVTISPVSLKRGSATPAEWFETFLIGSYGIFEDTVNRKLNEIVSINTVNDDGSRMAYAQSSQYSARSARICGKTCLRTSDDKKAYLVYRVE